VTDQLLIRDVPQKIRSWIDEERHAQRMSQKEFVHSILRDAYQNTQTKQNEQPALFGPPKAGQIVRESAGHRFKFIDLFAGIGGFRLGLQNVGGECVFTSEWDVHSQKTYRAWFGEVPQGDITKIDPKDIPDHDVLAAGFPCQPFSLAGVSKKNSLGRLHGFECATQGTMFFFVANIVEIKRPPILILENVKNLLSHDKGNTWKVIKATLDELGYKVFHKVIDAADYVPQHRERVFIVCFDKRVFGEEPPFQFPAKPSTPRKTLAEILDPNPDDKYTLSDHLWNYLQEYAKRHQAKGNGFGFGLVNPEETPQAVTRTLSARYHKDGSEILLAQKGKNPRRLTPYECARLMGFPDSIEIVVSDTQAYRQFGNALCPLIAEAIGEEVLDVMRWRLMRDANGCMLKGRVITN
jgi:DNA (cytosine-5)-methyltransferase 1